MKKLLAGLALLVTTSVTGSLGIVGSARADDSPAPRPPVPGNPDPGTAYALGGAHVLGLRDRALDRRPQAQFLQRFLAVLPGGNRIDQRHG